MFHINFLLTLFSHDLIYIFAAKTLFKLITQAKKLKIKNIFEYITKEFVDKKYTKKKVLSKNGFECDQDKICKKLILENNFIDFLKILKTNNIKITQITGAIYKFSWEPIMFASMIKQDKKLKNQIKIIYSQLFGVNVKSYGEIENIAKKSHGNWFIPWLFTYGQERRSNIVRASLNYDKVYVREALGYSRDLKKDDFKFINIKDNVDLKNEFNCNYIIDGSSYFKIVKNGVFENIMKKYKKETISGFSGSCVMIYQCIFNLYKIFNKSMKNKLLVLLMIIVDFYPFYHSISEILVTYTREANFNPVYTLDMDEIIYIKNMCKKYNIHIKL